MSSISRSKIVTPLHTAQIGRGTLRFFPPAPGATELPRHCADDLAICLGFRPCDRRGFQAILADGPCAREILTVATCEGLVTTAPHFGALALIGCCIHVRIVPPQFEYEYLDAVIEAFKRMGHASSIEASEIVNGALQFSSGLMAHLRDGGARS
jgi:hypothetical protein